MRRHAFTIVELLVVISLIVLLVAMLLPSLGVARESSRDVVCRTQMRSVMQCFRMFANDHRATLPAFWYEGAESWQKVWAGSEVSAGKPTKGTILPYIGGEEGAIATYRCPSLAPGVWASGVGSNGKFDYSAFTSFSGAKTFLIAPTASWVDPGTGVKSDSLTPVLVEEDPRYHINFCCIETGHGSIDKQGAWHRSGSNIASIDGGAGRLVFTASGPDCYDWTTMAPSGLTIQMIDTLWGKWNDR